MLIEVAFTAPEESALPWAVAHRPTLTAVDVAARSPVILVVEVSVTVLFVVVALPVLPAARAKSRAATTMFEPETETTDPVAMAVIRAAEPLPGAPDGKFLPDGNPDGTFLPDGNPDGRAPPRNPLPPPPPKPPAHDPLVAVVTETVCALKLLALDDVPDVAIAVTQLPALIELAARVTCWVNLVEDVQLTATCPLCWLCTCMVVPVTAAICPDAAGPRAAPAPPPGLAGALEDVPPAGSVLAAAVPPVLADDEPPQAASVIAAPRASTPPVTMWVGQTAAERR